MPPPTDLLTAATASRRLPPWPDGRPLRAWQRAALRRFVEEVDDGGSFLASATPAAGKTTFGLRVAYELLARGEVERVCVVAPTTHIARQWAADAARYGIDLEPNRPNGDGVEPRDRHGVSVTYATVAAGPAVHAAATARRRTLLLADEPHHLGEHASWGTSAQRAFGDARARLLLSGTPFRTDQAAIPWVTYDDEGLSCADYVYRYGEALRDRVCRPITFLPYDGDMEWVSDNRRRRAAFDVALGREESARRLRTALDAEGDWMGEVLRDAEARLSAVRAAGHADAGGLVVASDKEHAGAIAARLSRIAGEPCEVVTSDEPDASARIARFGASRRRWLVSVLMVSEGVDLPRLRVGVYATSSRTELFFRQVVGRFIRRTPTPDDEQMSWLLLPADPRLKQLAAAVEEERVHALNLAPAHGEEEVERAEPARGTGKAFSALSSSARADDAILSETSMQLFATGDEPPASSAPSPPPPPSPAEDPWADLDPSAPGARAQPPIAATAASSLSREALRDQRADLVRTLSRLTGEQHRAIHARVNARTGARSVAASTASQLRKGNARLEREIERRRRT